jgi:hypothetical protein
MTMTMKTCLAGCLLAALFAMPAHAIVQRELAIASGLDDGALLYREEHLVRLAGNRTSERLVLYRCLDGSAFARKRVRYGDDPYAPSFLLEDARSGYREGAERTADGLRVAWSAPGEAESTALVRSGDLVADAGFDEWVRSAWAPLSSGETLSLDFLVPSRLRTYRFDVESIAAEDPGLRAFRLRLGGWFGRLLPSIEVAYDATSLRLVRFEGLSNLRDDAGDAPMKVRIDFPEPPSAIEPAAFDRALAEPLLACPVLPA